MGIYSRSDCDTVEKRLCPQGHGEVLEFGFGLVWFVFVLVAPVGTPIMCCLCNASTIASIIAGNLEGWSLQSRCQREQGPLRNLREPLLSALLRYASDASLDTVQLLVCSKLTVPQATAYGRCIVADYTAVHKDMCAKEFMRLKDCYLV